MTESCQYTPGLVRNNHWSNHKVRPYPRGSKWNHGCENKPYVHHRRLENEEHQFRIAHGPDGTTGFHDGQKGNYKTGMEKVKEIRRNFEKRHSRGVMEHQKKELCTGKTLVKDRKLRMGNNKKYTINEVFQLQAERNQLKKDKEYLMKKLLEKKNMEVKLSNKIDNLNNDISSLQNTFIEQIHQTRTEFAKELQTLKEKMAYKLRSVSKVYYSHPNSSQEKPQFSLNPDAPVHVPTFCTNHISKEKKPQSRLNPDAPVHVPVSCSSFWPQDDFPDSKCMAENNSGTVKPEFKEEDLVKIIANILTIHGRVSIGKMGSLLHKAANDHRLPALMKQRYGGLKKFLQNHEKEFIVDNDHPYNPHVELHAGMSDKPIPISKVRMQSLESELSPLKELIQSKEKQVKVGNINTKRSLSNEQFLPMHSQLSPFTNPSGFVGFVCKILSLGLDPKRTFLAHICIVGFTGEIIYDKYAKLCDNDEDFCCTSDIDSSLITKAINASNLRKEVIKVLKDKVIIGHSIHCHLQILALNNAENLLSPHMIRDIASYSGLCPKHPLSLNTLVMERLGVDLKSEVNDPATEARAILAVYKSVAKEWEEEVFRNLIIKGSAQMQLTCKEQKPQISKINDPWISEVHSLPNHLTV